MENKINVAELLRNCPKGMELDCTNYNGVVTFKRIVDNSNYPIEIRVKCGDEYFTHTLTKYGQTTKTPYNKCVIFPKGKTTWEGFVPPCKFKIEKSKWYVCTKDLLDNYANKAFRKGDIYYSPEDGYLIPSNSNVPSKVEYCTDEYFRDWTIEDAKDGEVLAFNDEIIVIFKDLYNKTSFHSYCHIEDGIFTISKEDMPDWWEGRGFYLATKEQCNIFFQKIKAAGYKWNTETKTLEKLPKFKVGDRIKHKTHMSQGDIVTEIKDTYYILDDKSALSFTFQDEYELVPNKFDITTLKPFESRVLVRTKHFHNKWIAGFFSHKDSDGFAPFWTTADNNYQQCIPYEGNEHLLGTTDDCDKYFKTWE